MGPIGHLVNQPIRMNFKEGIKLNEFLLSCYGGRSGVVDTSLRTSISGYITRRLVDISHFQVISIKDCGTKRGLRIFPLVSIEGKVFLSCDERIRGRILSTHLPIRTSKKKFIDEFSSKKVIKKFIKSKFRSTLTCRAKFIDQIFIMEGKEKNNHFRICQYCYGWSFSEASLVTIGEAVGVISAQAIGEPGTQLTMRTFHTGGVFSGSNSHNFLRKIRGKVYFPKIMKGNFARFNSGKISFISTEKSHIFLITHFKTKKFNKKVEIFLPRGVMLIVRQHQFVNKGRNIAIKIQKKHSTKIESKIYNLNRDFRGEVIFEDVSIKNITSLKLKREKKVFQKKYEKDFIIIFKRTRSRNYSRVCIAYSHPLKRVENIVNHYIFPSNTFDLVIYSFIKHPR